MSSSLILTLAILHAQPNQLPNVPSDNASLENTLAELSDEISEWRVNAVANPQQIPWDEALQTARDAVYLGRVNLHRFVTRLRRQFHDRGQITLEQGLKQIDEATRDFNRDLFHPAAQLGYIGETHSAVDEDSALISAVTIVNGKGLERQLAAEFLQDRDLTPTAVNACWVTQKDLQLEEKSALVVYLYLPFNETRPLTSEEQYPSNWDRRLASWIVARQGDGRLRGRIVAFNENTGLLLPEVVSAMSREITRAECLASSRKLDGTRKTVEERRADAEALRSQDLETDYHNQMAYFKKEFVDPINTAVNIYDRNRFKSWLLSPAAGLWLIPFSALQLKGDDGFYAIENRNISYLMTGRDWTINPEVQPSAQTLVFATPNFGPSARQSSAHDGTTASGDTRFARYNYPSSKTHRSPSVPVSIASWHDRHHGWPEFSSIHSNRPSNVRLACHQSRGCRSVRHRYYVRRRQFRSYHCYPRKPSCCRPMKPQTPEVKFPILLGQGCNETRRACVLGEFGNFVDGADQALIDLAETIFANDSRHLTSDSADERAYYDASVRNGRSPREIWFLTHGFFLDRQQCAGRILGENPLIRCGIALAEANGATKISPVDPNDGLLVGTEIARSDLRGTNLVGLIACKGGVGDVTGASLASCRQSFLLAGTRAVLASSWSVTLTETKELIEQFQRARDFDENTETALRIAQRAIIKSLRQRGESTHPFFWASFSLTGRTN